MAWQPPTRPHSANPHISLKTQLFPRPPSSASQHSPKRSSANSASRRHGGADWEDEDAWDSGSDHEHDGDESEVAPHMQRRDIVGGVNQAVAPIPIRSNSHNSQLQQQNTAVVGSWSSGSYSYIARPALSTSKTITEGTIPPLPGTALASANRVNNGSPHSQSGVGSNGSKLPPGGAWELVEPPEPAEDVADVNPPVKIGKEAIREDVNDILNDPLQLLASLSISAPSSPMPSTFTAPTSNFPFLTPSRQNSSYSNTSPLSVVSSISARSPSPHTSQLGLPDQGSSSQPDGLRTPRKQDLGVGRQRSVRTERKREKFAKALKGKAESGNGVDMAELRRLAWNGIPNEVRPIAWQLLLHYLPTPSAPRLTTLHRKRKEYSSLVDQYFGRGLGALDQQMWHQIEIDVPRTRPGVPLWSCVTAQRALERILYVWAIRHPAAGYVQGINDLVTPFFEVFLSAYIDTEPETFDVAFLSPEILSAIEADSFWCLSKLLDGIQDNYISQQPGIQRLVKRMSELVKRIDGPLAAHFEDQGVEFMQFAFRWMNCLLMREINAKCTIRMWDTYLAEGTDAFSQFHLYVCSALLVKYSERLREMDFQEMIIFLQCLPTQSWTDHDIELLLSEAFVLKAVWQGAENHFANQKVNGGGFGMLGR